MTEDGKKRTSVNCGKYNAHLLLFLLLAFCLTASAQPSNVVTLDGIQINKTQRTIAFPATLNLAQGQMEYLLVTTEGKLHESILRTEKKPWQIHTAMLLLGVNKTETNRPPATTQEYVSNPSPEKLPGTPVKLEIRWNSGAQQTTRPAEQLIYNTETKTNMASGHWVYNGSRIINNTFLADQEGSIASLVTDPNALINYTGPGHDKDQIWTANTNAIPPAGLPVEVVIQIIKEPAHP